MSKIKLLPCPFCGGKVTITNYGYRGEEYIIEHPDPLKTGSAVICPIASHEGDGVGALYYDTEQEAADAWNNRTPST